MTASRRFSIGAATAVLAFTTIVLAPATAHAAPAPGSQCSPSAGVGQIGLYTDVTSSHDFLQCAYGAGDSTVAVVMACPQGTEWNPRDGQCGYPGFINPGTSLITGTAQLSVLPLRISGLTATLIDSGGTPVYGATITFTDLTGQTLCSAATNWLGAAACSTTNLAGDVEGLLAGYTATFAGNGGNLASDTATGSVTLG